MPKRNIKPNKVKPPQLPQLRNGTDTAESLESELRFDQEVLWCISQFEVLINSGKLNDAKKNESVKAINTLRKSTVSKIEKIQLMKSYFKDYKTKMAQATVADFECDTVDSKASGKFLKKKTVSEASEKLPEPFLFNFNNENSIQDELISEAINKVRL